MKRIVSTVLLLSLVATVGFAQDKKDKEEKPKGLLVHTDKAFPGLNLFTPLDSGSTYLMDNAGRVINEWRSEFRPSSVYLRENGNIVRLSTYGRDGNGTFHGGGAGYCVEEFNWEGERVWQYIYSTEKYLMHHDIELLPNGNVLLLAWEMKKEDEALAAGRDPELIKDGEIWSEKVVEVKPVYPDSGEIVWEWHLWDHLIQDIDSTKENYGDVGAHPGKVDINPTGHWLDKVSDEELEELEALGYLGGEESDKKKHRGTTGADWLHTNAIAYNAERDEIALSALGNNEIWVIRHAGTTEEAKGPAGDILYRWGNPVAYHAGFEEDQRLFAQHDVHWIAEGLPGAGDLLIFNNGRGRPDGNYSTVEQLTPPLDENGDYELQEGMAYGPYEPTWQHKEEGVFFSSYISGARRLPNGNTIICQGADGTLFEVTSDNEVVWKYVNPAYPKHPPVPDGKKLSAKERRARKSYNNIVFRVYRYGFDYPAFEGRDLSPGPLLKEYIEDHPAVTPLELPEEMKKKKD